MPTERGDGTVITTTETERIYRVTGDDPRLVIVDLNAAVELAQEQAMGEGKQALRG